MQSNYEIIRYKQGLNARILVHSVNRFKLHWHKELEIILVLKGTATLTIGNKKYELQQDDLLLVNSGEVHSTIASGENILAVVQINPDFCKKTFPELEHTHFAWPDVSTAEENTLFLAEMRRCIAGIVQEYRKAGDGYQLAIEGFLNTLVLLLVRNVPRMPDTDAAKNKHSKDKELSRIQRIMEYIQQNYTEKITLEQLAKSEYLSVYYLSHFFKEKTGITFQEYLNHVRLQNAVLALNQGDKRINDIALDSGFASVKALNKAFKDAYGTTPGEYRSLLGITTGESENSTSYMEFDAVAAMEKLQEYLLHGDESVLQGTVLRDTLTTTVHTHASQGTLFPNWTRLGAVGRAHDILRADLQRQLCEAAQYLKIEHLRFHGIFSEEMRVVTRSPEGALRFCWRYIDLIFDFLLSIGVRPMVDFTFMPHALKSTDKTVFWYQGNISLPQDMGDWASLVHHFAAHCIARYGITEVRQWYFEVWNEPDYMWQGTPGEYYGFYAATAKALLQADPHLQVAGPSILQTLSQCQNWLAGFVEFLNHNNLPLHCFTHHIYGENYFYVHGSHIIPRLAGKDHVQECIQEHWQTLRTLKRPVQKCFITEYNISGAHKNYLLDTMFAACAILYNYLQNHNRTNGIAFWTLSDIFEEDPALLPPFSGGFGLVTAEGIRKPGWYAHWFLTLLGDEIVEQQQDYIITKRGEDIQILAFFYLFYDRTFLEGDRSLLQYKRRYDVFGLLPPKEFSFAIEGVYGNYEVREYILDRQHGSAFDIYEEMGCPAELSTSDVDYLKGKAKPSTTVLSIQMEGTHQTCFTLPQHGIRLLLLKKCPPPYAADAT